jgi:phage FluMu protein Com
LRMTESLFETLTCASCGRTFERSRTRGRKPLKCPDCTAVGFDPSS